MKGWASATLPLLQELRKSSCRLQFLLPGANMGSTYVLRLLVKNHKMPTWKLEKNKH